MGLIFDTLQDDQRRALAEQVIGIQYGRDPSLADRYGTSGRAKCVDDANYTLLYLESAVRAGSPELFSEYLIWLRGLMESVGVAADDVISNLSAMRHVLAGQDSAFGRAAADYIDTALAAAAEMPVQPSHIDSRAPLSGLARRYLDGLLRNDRRGAAELVLDAAAQGVAVADLYEHVFQPCLREIGRLWQRNEISVAQEHLFTAATQMVMSQLYPRIFDRPANGRSMVAVCANGELHEIGVRMVADMFEMAGWETTYVGASTPVAAVVKLLCEVRPDLLAVSATIAPNVANVAALIAAVRETPELAAVRVMVGGTPFNQAHDLWRRVGADGWAPDARSAISEADILIQTGSTR